MNSNFLDEHRQTIQMIWESQSYADFPNRKTLLSASNELDELHMISAEQDCDNPDATVKLYSFAVDENGELRITYTFLFRHVAWNYVQQKIANGEAEVIGHSCNANGFAANGWMSIRLAMVKETV